MIRFLHTSDRQLGMARHFFSDGAQERYNRSGFDAIGSMGQIAKENECQFVLVCGDLFEPNLVDRKAVVRAAGRTQGCFNPSVYSSGQPWPFAGILPTQPAGETPTVQLVHGPS